MCFWVCVLLLLLKGALSLRLLSLNVPTSVVVGDVIMLSCGYDLEGDTLYSIKWYRDDVEFFRFVPRDKPPGQFFPLTGVQVDVVRSTNGTVYIHDTDVSTTGTYKCEVSADAPSFQTVSAQKVLVVSEFSMSSGCCQTSFIIKGSRFHSTVRVVMVMIQMLLIVVW